jgi:hypothetical protein
VEGAAEVGAAGRGELVAMVVGRGANGAAKVAVPMGMAAVVME